MVAALHAFSRNVDAAFLSEMTEVVVNRAVEMEPASVQKDALECYIRFATTPAVPRAAREAVLARLPEFVEATLVTDPEQWGGYGLQPLDIADSPASRLYAPFREHVDRHLDYVVETQGEDGAWSPHWKLDGDVPGGLGAGRGRLEGRAHGQAPAPAHRLRPHRLSRNGFHAGVRLNMGGGDVPYSSGHFNMEPPARSM